jgi:hypothetical protein|eukprot:SAG25_NODE_1462_length_2968_cov_14.097595_5_plen_143_part_00
MLRRLTANQPMPYDAMGPVRHEVTDVWMRRRLRVLPPLPDDALPVSRKGKPAGRGNRWCSGRVMGFTQTTTGPFTDRVSWSVTIQFDEDEDKRPALLRAPPMCALPDDLPDFEELASLPYADMQVSPADWPSLWSFLICAAP